MKIVLLCVFIKILLFFFSNLSFAENCDYYLREVVITKGKYYHNNNPINGVVCSYSSNGRAETPIKNGKIDGIYAGYFNNGSPIFYVPFENGKEEGIGRWFYNNGLPAQEISYKNGKFNGYYRKWYDNGVKEYECLYEDGEIIGGCTSYHTNGAIKTEVSSQNDKSIVRSYDELHRKTFEVIYKQGDAIKGTCHLKNGEKINLTNSQLRELSSGMDIICR